MQLSVSRRVRTRILSQLLGTLGSATQGNEFGAFRQLLDSDQGDPTENGAKDQHQASG
jgi:hypothetical protein